MSKNSKLCGYTGHMRVLKRQTNVTKEKFDAKRNQLHMHFEHGQPAKHLKKGDGVVYPEDQCVCKK